MKILLDTHVLLLWVTDSAQLSTEVRDLFAPGSHELLWSAASTWELGIKAELGKIRLPESLEEFVPRQIADQGLTGLPIYHDHALRAARLTARPRHTRENPHRNNSRSRTMKPLKHAVLAAAIVLAVALLASCAADDPAGNANGYGDDGAGDDGAGDPGDPGGTSSPEDPSPAEDPSSAEDQTSSPDDP